MQQDLRDLVYSFATKIDPSAAMPKQNNEIFQKCGIQRKGDFGGGWSGASAAESNTDPSKNVFEENKDRLAVATSALHEGKSHLLMKAIDLGGATFETSSVDESDRQGKTPFQGQGLRIDDFRSAAAENSGCFIPSNTPHFVNLNLIHHLHIALNFKFGPPDHITSRR